MSDITRRFFCAAVTALFCGIWPARKAIAAKPRITAGEPLFLVVRDISALLRFSCNVDPRLGLLCTGINGEMRRDGLWAACARFQNHSGYVHGVQVYDFKDFREMLAMNV